MSPIGAKKREPLAYPHSSAADLFKVRFLQRSDQVAVYREHYEPFAVDGPTHLDQLLIDHLAGKCVLGVYTLTPEDPHCRFAMIDVDTGNATDVSAVQAAVYALGVKPNQLLIEESGRKGWHLWLFFNEPYPLARDVRQWLAPAAAGHELNPKQDTVEAGGYGNLVKLPLGKHPVSGQWSKFITPKTLQEVQLVDPATIPRASERVRLPADGSMVRTGFGCTDAILKGQVAEGRHNALVHAGLHLRKHGVTWDEAGPTLERINSSFPSPIGDRELEAEVLGAEPSRNVGPTCQSQWSGVLCDKESCKYAQAGGPGGGRRTASAVGDLDSYLEGEPA